MQKQGPYDVEKAVCLHLARTLQELSAKASRLFDKQSELEDRLHGAATDLEKANLRERIRELQNERQEIRRQDKIVSDELGVALERAEGLQATHSQD